MMSPAQILALSLANKIGHTVYEDSVEVDTTEYDKDGMCTMVGELNDNDTMRKFEFSFFFDIFKMEYERIELKMLDEDKPEPEYDFIHHVENIQVESGRPHERYQTIIRLGELEITSLNVTDIYKLHRKISARHGVEPLKLGITIL